MRKILMILFVLVEFVFAQFTKTTGPQGVNSLVVLNSQVFASTWGQGLFISSDFGKTWRGTNNGLKNKFFFSLTSSENKLFAAGGDGVFLFNRKNWIALNNGFPAANVFQVAIKGAKIYAGTNGSGVAYSNDYGMNWSTINLGLPNNGDPTFTHSIAIHGSKVFAGCNGGTFLLNENVFVWEPVSLQLKDCGLIATNQKTLFASTDGKLFISKDNGKTWTQSENGLEGRIVLSIVFYENYVIVGTSQGLSISKDEGNSWTSINDDEIASTSIRAITICPPNVIVANEKGIYYTPTNILSRKETKSLIDNSKATQGDKVDWIKIVPNNSKNGFNFSTDGYLTYKGKSTELQIPIYSDIGKKILPELFISPKSPNNQFVFLTGRKDEDFKFYYLLDLTTMRLFNANETHYGPAMWVRWSRTNKYAILHDPESGLMQSINLETKKIVTLPLAERNGVGTIYNLSSENSFGALESKDQWAEVDVESFKWNKDETKFTVDMKVRSYEKVFRTYKVEADILNSRVLEVK